MTMRSWKNLPARRTEGLLIESIGDEVVVYDLESKEAHCLKALAAITFTEADGRSSVSEVAALAAERLGHPVSETEVVEAITQLQGRSLLEEILPVRDGLSRREAVKRTAFAGAVAFAAPLITSIVAPTAAMAASGIPSGCFCGGVATADGCKNGDNHKCQSQHCCQPDSGKDCNQCKCVSNSNNCSFTSTGGCNVEPAPVGGCP